jgi:sigma-B regulation protein RsbU (phosphoserine phosphatase)
VTAESAKRDLRPPPLIAEIGLYLDNVGAPFGTLRADAILESSAALALVLAMGAIGLRFGQYLRGRQLAEQLEVARRVQLDLLPSAASIPDGLSFTGECLPAWRVGGDFYDVFRSDEGQMTMVLGDVSGKGLPAALLSSLLQGAVRSMSGTSHESAQEQAARKLNDLLCARSARERFASLFWCHYDPKTSVLRYINAGHLPPWIVGRNQEGGFNIRRLEQGGPVLGLLPYATYRQGKTVVSPGELLVMFSDGITEATDPNDEEFGEHRLLAIIRENWNRTPRQICNEVLHENRSFLEGLHPQDDQTLVIVRLKPETLELAPDEMDFASVAV